MMKKVLFVYDQLHPMHKSLFESIGVDFIRRTEKIPKNYDVYIFEASYARGILFDKIGKIGRNKIVLSLFADPRLYYLDNLKMFDFEKNRVKKYPKIRARIMKTLLLQLGGAFCLCEPNFLYFKKFSKNAPALKFTGFISKRKFKKLGKITPKLENQEIIFIGYGPDYYCKGLDILIESFKLVKNKVPSAKLKILGKWKIKKEWKTDGVEFLGHIKDIGSHLKNSSLGVHMGRGEAFGVNIPEMMLAGIPVITSNFTGAKEVVTKFNKSYVVRMNKNDISNKILDYFKLSNKEKVRLSRAAKKVARNYSEYIVLKKFKREAREFIENL